MVSVTGELLRNEKLKYVFVDEVSMVPEMFSKFFCTWKRLRPDIKFIVAGDFRQYLPVNDRVEGCDYANSSALMELCNNNMLQLTKCRRSDAKLFNMCQEENIGKLKATDFGNKSTKRHICYTNKKRKQLNEDMMAKEAKVKITKFKAAVVEFEPLDYDDNSQKVKVYAGLPVIARVNHKTLGICNNDTMTVKAVRKKSSTIEIEMDVEDQDGVAGKKEFKIEFDDFQRLFYPAYAITSHKSQGSTYDHAYTVWEWDHPRFDERAKYVVLSRAKKYEYVNVIA